MVTTRTSKVDVLAAFRRTELLAAARKVFGNKGFEQATVDAIAEEAGVAKGTVYLYYPSKQAIYDALFREGMVELEEQLQARLESARGLRDVIAAFVDVKLRYFLEFPDYYRIYVAEVGRQLSDHAPKENPCKVAIDSQARKLQKRFEQAVSAGEIRAIDPAAASMAVFDITRGLVGRRLLNRETSDPAADVAFITDLIWTGLARHSDHKG